MTCHAFDAVFVEKVCAVLNRAVKAVIHLDKLQEEVIHRCAGSYRIVCGFGTRNRQLLVPAVLVNDEQHLEQWAAAAVTLGFQMFNEQLKR